MRTMLECTLSKTLTPCHSVLPLLHRSTIPRSAPTGVPRIVAARVSASNSSFLNLSHVSGTDLQNSFVYPLDGQSTRPLEVRK